MKTLSTEGIRFLRDVAIISAEEELGSESPVRGSTGGWVSTIGARMRALIPRALQ